ncbi:unnamed protein product [Paramecium pentaurelia]|uniref:Uncharacterized protein n=1 Tax=Paramecium pentaurelia TaxID=43138 RepID=A0A8S1X2S5_9CILI|nr:unnamed protein product [Paramecium pentaurelia]
MFYKLFKCNYLMNFIIHNNTILHLLMNRIRIYSQRNRYNSIDESKFKSTTYRPIQEKNLQLINKNTLILYINRICKYIQELQQYKNEGYIRNILNKIFTSTSNFKDIQEIFNIPVVHLNRDILLNRTIHFINTLQIKPSQQTLYLQNFMKWFAYLDELLYSEMEKIHEHYLCGIQSKIVDQIKLNKLKQVELKRTLNPKKKEIIQYINQFSIKPIHKQFSSVQSIEQYENKFGEFDLISSYSRNYAKQLDKINLDLNQYYQ